MAKSKVGTSTSKVNARKSGTSRPHTRSHATEAKSVPGHYSRVTGHRNNGQTKAAFPENHFANAHHAFGLLRSHSGVELGDKVKELLRLAQEQGYLTYNDVNDALPDHVVTPEELDDIYIKLRNLDSEIVEQGEVDRVKQTEPQEQDDKSRIYSMDESYR